MVSVKPGSGRAIEKAVKSALNPLVSVRAKYHLYHHQSRVDIDLQIADMGDPFRERAGLSAGPRAQLGLPDLVSPTFTTCGQATLAGSMPSSLPWKRVEIDVFNRDELGALAQDGSHLDGEAGSQGRLAEGIVCIRLPRSQDRLIDLTGPLGVNLAGD